MTTTATEAALPGAARRATPRRLDVQGLRGIAVLMVVVFHAGLPFSGGFTGVDVFFVISGFVIAQGLLTELQSTQRIDLKAFYQRRIRRLLPALSLLVTVTVILAYFLQSPYKGQDTTALTAIGAMLLTANLVLYRSTGSYFGTDAETNPLLHTWSLSVEEQFYLVFPALLIAGWLIGRRARRSRVGVGAAVLVLGVASFVFSIVLTFDLVPIPGLNLPEVFAFYSSLSRAWEFAIGVGIALAMARFTRLTAATAHGDRICAALGFAGVGALVAAAVLINKQQSFPGWLALVPTLGAAALLLAGARTNSFARVLSTRPLVWLGDLSYSWYLWHWPLIVFATALWPFNKWLIALVAGLSILPAWASYRLVENPIRYGGTFKSSKRIVGLAAVAVVVPCVLAVGLAKAPGPSGEGRVPAAPAASWDMDECVYGTTYDRNLETCEFPLDGEAQGTALLVGDSHAAALTSGFVDASHALKLDAYASTLPGCPVVVAGAKPNECDAFYAHIDAWIEQNQPDLIVLQERSAHYTNSPVSMYDEEREFVTQPCLVDGDSCATGERAWDVWGKGLEEVLRRYTATGAKVLVVADTPEHTTDGPAMTSRLLGVAEEGTPRSVVDERRNGVVAAERDAVDAVPGVEFVDPIELFCDENVCSIVAENKFLYVDDDHVSTVGTARLAELLEQAMRPMAPAR